MRAADLDDVLELLLLFGERIAQGLALNNTSMLLAGAIPSAALALLIQGGFYIYERRLAHRRG
jgi:osmoprotectant transport system permease protein